MILESNGTVWGLSFYERGLVFLVVLFLSILAAASRIIRCASNDKIPNATIWTGVLIVVVGGFVFIATFLRVIPQLSVH